MGVDIAASIYQLFTYTGFHDHDAIRKWFDERLEY